MGLFTKTPTGPVEKVECNSCNKKFSEENINSYGLCASCEDKMQCGDCEKYFDELDEEDRCTVCAKAALDEEGDEEVDCDECGKTLLRKNGKEHDDVFLCEKCWEKMQDNEAVMISIDLTGVKNTFRWTDTKVNQDKIYAELVNAMKTGQEFIDLPFKDSDKGFIRTSTISSIYYHLKGEQYDEDTDYEDNQDD